MKVFSVVGNVYFDDNSPIENHGTITVEYTYKNQRVSIDMYASHERKFWAGSEFNNAKRFVIDNQAYVVQYVIDADQVVWYHGIKKA